mmetsp:Transcript_18169/g.24110  ORF Transcript_18169/g.24110 Transcript_18169/m.24110 type:complete len:128 (+) Transcript_18169:194-577(+)
MTVMAMAFAVVKVLDRTKSLCAETQWLKVVLLATANQQSLRLDLAKFLYQLPLPLRTQPTNAPTTQPTNAPTTQPTATSTHQPTPLPTANPNAPPTNRRTVTPNNLPLDTPTSQSTSNPSHQNSPTS